MDCLAGPMAKLLAGFLEHGHNNLPIVDQSFASVAQG
jgi:hypothetical protein